MSNRNHIPIVFNVRMNSMRCPGKCDRDFHKGQSLTDIALAKFSGRDDVFLASGDSVFKDYADRHSVGFIQRDSISANGETVEEVWNFMDLIPGDYICAINVCAPFLRAETISNAIDTFRNESCDTLVPIHEIKDIVLDEDKRPVNKDATVFNSKLRKSLYLRCGTFIIFSKEKTLKHGKYFTAYEPGEPYLYPIDLIETMDIDTEEQFQIIQATYNHRNP